MVFEHRGRENDRFEEAVSSALSSAAHGSRQWGSWPLWRRRSSRGACRVARVRPAGGSGSARLFRFVRCNR
jgi:hypothetical protein